jgi:hypothetical protein
MLLKRLARVCGSHCNWPPASGCTIGLQLELCTNTHWPPVQLRCLDMRTARRRLFVLPNLQQRQDMFPAPQLHNQLGPAPK